MCNDKSNKNMDHAHNDEHEAWSRRTFLQALGIAGTGAFTLAGTQISSAAISPLTAALTASTNDRALILIRLKGGNDGLNTIVPVYDYDTYIARRPAIALPRNSLYALNSSFGLPSFMSSLQNRWGNGQMKVVHGVGYQNQNLSHFKSSDIWATTDATAVADTGWLGRFFENDFPDFIVNPPAVPPAIQIGSSGNLAFEGVQTNYAFSVSDPEELFRLAQNGNQHDPLSIPPCTYGQQLSFMRSTTNTTYTYAGVINDAYSSSTTQSIYGNHSIGKQMSIVARLLKGQLGTKIYMVTLDGFDTHANQPENHARQLQRLAETINNFYTDLQASGLQDNVLCMTISEFGRRVEQNGSAGTDHGAAAPVMLFGGGLQDNGFVGTHPSLTNLDNNGNMIHATDFRDLYATLLTDWLCVPQDTVNKAMLNRVNTAVSLGFNCATAGVSDLVKEQIRHFVINREDQAILYFEIDFTRKLDIRIYNFIGQEIGVLSNQYYNPGRHEISIKETLKQRLATGNYIYRIDAGNEQYSKQFLIR